MSSLFDRSSDFRNWWNLGGIVEFDGPCGDRLQGEIVRTSSNPDYLHVAVDGRTYEVSINGDNATQIGGW